MKKRVTPIKPLSWLELFVFIGSTEGVGHRCRGAENGYSFRHLGCELFPDAGQEGGVSNGMSGSLGIGE